MLFGKAAVKKEREYLRRITMEVISEKMLMAESKTTLGEALGAIDLAWELELISLEEYKSLLEEAERKTFDY